VKGTVKRICLYVFTCLPGLGLAMVAKPLVLGEVFLWAGIFLALGAPVVVYLVEGSSRRRSAVHRGSAKAVEAPLCSQGRESMPERN